MSSLARLGVAVTLAGALWDVSYHGLALPAGLDGAAAHVLTLVGMLLVLAGVVERGFRSLKEETSYARR
ncbi:MAG TPA: hypothetical protein VGL99_30960 [Chloroflexota bacterium]|jgi:hypothetical protein